MRDADLWWKRGIVYQVYPRSFQDTDGDGVGDLQGVRRRLQYLQDLGVDAIWLSPIFVSPMADFGYDIADYCAVAPIFGSMQDIDALIADCHRRGLRVILDFVPNHTSDQHPWFVESRRDRTNAKRDWYIWRDGKPDGSAPNNWISNFGGSAWTCDAATGQFFYHAFLREQPDLNWRNPAVRAAMAQVLRFWLDRGIDGFRVDVIWHLIKDAELRDNPVNPDFADGQPEIARLLQTHSTDQPDVHAVIAELRRVVDAYPQRVLIGEIYLPVERLVTYYGHDLAGVHLPFNFQLLDAPWSARAIADIVVAYEAALPRDGWPNWVLGNHDRPRIAQRVGREQARVAAMLLLTLRGTPTMYYGDEIGMADVAVSADRWRDPWAHNEAGFGRDPERTPMQWDASRNAGFTEGEPWLPLADDSVTRNVAVQSDDPTSMLTLYRRLIALRRASPALEIGSFTLGGVADNVLWYERRHANDRAIVVLNFGAEPATLPSLAVTGLRIALSTALDRKGTVAPPLLLRANEGLILQPLA